MSRVWFSEIDVGVVGGNENPRVHTTVFFRQRSVLFIQKGSS